MVEDIASYQALLAQQKQQLTQYETMPLPAYENRQSYILAQQSRIGETEAKIQLLSQPKADVYNPYSTQPSQISYESLAQEQRLAKNIGFGGTINVISLSGAGGQSAVDPRTGLSWEEFKQARLTPAAQARQGELGTVGTVIPGWSPSGGREESRYRSDSGESWKVAPGMAGSWGQTGVTRGERPLVPGTNVPIGSSTFLTAEASSIASERGGAIFYGRNNLSNTVDLDTVNRITFTRFAPGTTPGNEARYGSSEWFAHEGALREAIGILNNPRAVQNKIEPDSYYMRVGSGEAKLKGSLIFGEAGEWNIYRKTYDPNTGLQRNYESPFAGGGRYSLQAGSLSMTSFYPTQDARYKELVAANPDLFSRPGAEKYGGMVLPVGLRTNAEAQYGQFPSSRGNLAGYVSPEAANLAKASLPSLNLPSELPTSSTKSSREVAPGAFLIPGTMEKQTPPATQPMTPFSPGWTPIGGLIGSAMFGEKRVEGVKGIIAGSLFTATAGYVDLSGVWGLTKTEPALETFRQQKTAQEQTLTGMETYGKQKFGTTPEGQIKIDTTSPEALAFETKYTAAKSQYEGLLTTAKQQGILKIEGGQFVENPDLTYKFGEATKWGLGAGKQVRGALGFSGEQLSAYETKLNAAPVPESLTGKVGYGAERIVFGAGKVLSTHPEEIVYGVGAGAIWATGGEVVGGGLGAVSEGGGRLAPLATRALAIGGSPIVRYGVPAAFVGMTAYSATEGFTAPLSKSLINVGGTALPLGGMLYGGMGTQAFLGSRFAGFSSKEYFEGEMPLKRAPTREELIGASGGRPFGTNLPIEMQYKEGITQPPSFMGKTRIEGLTPSDIIFARPETPIKPSEFYYDMSGAKAVKPAPSGILPDITQSSGFRFEGTKGAPAPLTEPLFIEEAGMRFMRQTGAGGKTFYAPDIPPAPMDWLPGTKINICDTGTMAKPMSPAEAAFGLKLKVESVFDIPQPKGISMPTGASQTMANPEIISGTRGKGITVPSVDTLISGEMKFKAFDKTARAQGVENILGRAEFKGEQPKFDTGKFENALKNVFESEKRAPSTTSKWKPTEAIDTGMSYDVGVVDINPGNAKFNIYKTGTQSSRNILDVDAIIRGETTDTYGKPFNAKAKLTWQTPDQFLNTQYEMFNAEGSAIAGEPYNPGIAHGKKVFELGVEADRLNIVRTAMKNPENVFDSFAVRKDAEGNIMRFQEGRHRAIILKELGYEKIPVWEITKAPKSIDTGLSYDVMQPKTRTQPLKTGESLIPRERLLKSVSGRNMGFGEYGPKQPSAYPEPISTSQSWKQLSPTQLSPTRYDFETFMKSQSKTGQSPLTITGQIPTIKQGQFPSLSQTPSQKGIINVITGQQPTQVQPPALKQTPGQKQIIKIINIPTQTQTPTQQQKQWKDVFKITTQTPGQPKPPHQYKDTFWMTPRTPRTPAPEKPYRDVFKITDIIPPTPVPPRTPVPTTKIPPPIIPIIPFGFNLPSGTDTGRGRGRSKSPFREMINIESQLFSAKKKRRKS